jgi:atlastin
VIPDENMNDIHTHPYGHPLSLMKFDENENITIDMDALDRTFLHPEVKDRKIVAISIIGAFRKGKSFLMDYALRYMYQNVSQLDLLFEKYLGYEVLLFSQYKSVSFMDNPLSNKRNWIGDVDAPLTGFSWRSGATRDTTGVVLWSDVFLHENLNPKTKKMEKLAIVLMDTQGLFYSKTSPTENSRIFALGTLISSIQIFNLNDVIQENQLQYLQVYLWNILNGIKHIINYF